MYIISEEITITKDPFDKMHHCKVCRYVINTMICNK